MKIVSGTADDASSTLYAWTYWNPATYGPNCEAFVTLTSYVSSDLIRIGARVTGAGTNTISGYFVSISSSGVWSIIRFDSSTDPVILRSGPTQPLASGDKIGIRIVGSNVSALLYTPTGGWNIVLSYNTAADTHRYTTAGAFALWFKASTADDFGGGTI
jgi:hypothetical protein